MATIYDIAKATGLSTATVSRALQGSRLIGPDIRGRVAACATDLGYKARTIRRPRSRAILSIRLVLPRPANPARALFYDIAELMDGLHKGFAGSLIQVVTDLTSPDYMPFPHKKGGDTDGFVFAFHRPEDAVLAELHRHQIPYVVLNRHIPGLPCVGLDHRAAMFSILQHLRQGNPKLHPVFVGLERLGEIQDDRSTAFLEAARSLAISLGTKPVRVFPSLDAIDGKAVQKLARHTNAIVAVNDIVAMLVLEELRGLGVDVPGKIAVTGFDDSPLRRLSRPLLTTSRR